MCKNILNQLHIKWIQFPKSIDHSYHNIFNIGYNKIIIIILRRINYSYKINVPEGAKIITILFTGNKSACMQSL